MLLPPSLEELVASHHPVRVVSQVIDSIDITVLEAQYKGGGTSSYHPRMLLKLLVYGYLCNIYSSRKLEEAAQQNIYFMWLCGMSQPDHNSINRFRSERLKEVLRKIFSQIVGLLVESGHVSLKEVYLDGTKIEANANRYTFVWGKAIKNNRDKIKAQLEHLWQYTQQVAAEELKDTTPTTFEQIDAAKVQRTIEQIDQALKKKEVSKKIRQKLSYAKKNWPAKLNQYEQQEKILNGRNSYSKTDPDATFMRMKEDHMKNGQLKPAYNVQFSTADQYIVNYTTHPTPSDTITLAEHLQEFEKLYEKKPQELTADAGYGSEQNYDFLEQEQITAYVKYNTFDREQRKSESNIFHPSRLHYNKQKDCYYCPMGQPMTNIGIYKSTTTNRYEQTITCYQAQRCEGCPLRGQCHKAKDNRIIEINYRLMELRQKASDLLQSEKGLYHRSKRPVDVEPVFGNIKHNKMFKRFMLRGKKKTEIEIGLLAIAHNLAKRAA